MANAIYEWGGGEKTKEVSKFKPFKFKGSGLEYFKIWIINMLLTLLTLGIYYPWAKVRNKKYFYANSILDGRHFDYHATGKQLFIGFLIGIALLFFYLILQQVSIEASIVVPFVLFLAIPWLIYRSLRFNLKMTSFSNVYFSFEGTTKESYINFFLYPLLFLGSLYFFPIVIAVFLPDILQNPNLAWISYLLPLFAILSLLFTLYMYGVMKKKNSTYIISNTRYGQGVFETTLKSTKFMMIALKTIFVTLFIFVLMVVIIGAIIYGTVGIDSLLELKDTLNDVSALQENIIKILPLVIPVYFAFLATFVFALAYSVAKQREYVYGNTTLDNKIFFISTLTPTAFFWVIVSNFFLVVLTLGLAFPWARVRVSRLFLQNTKIDASFGINEYLSQKQKEQSALEEEISDAFDLDVGIGV